MATRPPEPTLRATERAYVPRRPHGLSFERIVLAKGALATPEREARSHAICAAYPECPVEERLDTPHNRIRPAASGDGPLARHAAGKRTLVLGEIGAAVRRSAERGNSCPDYWHFTTHGFCPYDCAYCYLAGSTGVFFAPTLRVYVNVDEVLDAIDRRARRMAEPTAFYLGKLQDALALDPLTGFARELVPFFAAHETARLTLLTKSAEVENLLGLDHAGHAALAWSLNAPEVAAALEHGAPPVAERLAAMQRCAGAGYPVRAIVMPMVPVDGWRAAYGPFVAELVATVPLQRLTLGGICSYPTARGLMEARLSPANAVSGALSGRRSADGRLRYPAETRVALYRCAVEAARAIRPGLPIALCLEEREVVEAVLGRGPMPPCNCLW
jgi:spore photoproduct lyase